MVSFCISCRYKDKVWCDVVTMDDCHLLLGRPWQFDRDVRHDGWKKYRLLVDATKFQLVPSKDAAPKPPVGVGSILLSMAKFGEEMIDTEVVYVLISKEVVEGQIILEPLQCLI